MDQSYNIILGVCGGIAAYKTALLARLLVKQGNTVQVVMTSSAQQFITPLTFQALTGRPVRTSLWDEHAEAAMGHIELARWADKIIIAPATANTLAKLAYGMADDLLTTLCLATAAEIYMAPAMNMHMWASAAVTANYRALQARKYRFIGPDSGEQACKDVGVGRMTEPEAIVEAVCRRKQLFSGKHFVITAGPTREPLDPIRFLSNRSSGKMGYALAIAARELGATVTLVSGPVALTAPDGVRVLYVDTAVQMHEAVMREVTRCDVFIATAAVCDYRSHHHAAQKIKKTEDDLVIKLARNPDILKQVAQLTPRPLVVGFAAETENVIANAKQKLQAKQCDFIVANDVSANQTMGRDSATVTLISSNDTVSYEELEKDALASMLLTEIHARTLLPA
jgi:phosphopantothenoylcysteine decarboxylase / phosphopantothenate---cysteine ligase